MFYKHKYLQEGFVHQCSDAHKYIKEHRQEIARVQKHDVHTHILIGTQIIPIKYCPYCGVDLATDEETNEYLNIKL